MPVREVDNGAFFAVVEEQLAAGHRVKLRLVGGSMRPALHEGDALWLAPMEGLPAVGDVVLFRTGGCHLLHRVVKVGGGRVRLQGDHCYTCEEVPHGEVLARVEEVQLASGSTMPTGSRQWRRRSRRSLCLKRGRNAAIWLLGRKGRRRFRPWYFALLAVLMWAPLNGVGLALDNFVFGIRLDHLLHASVYLPCVAFLADLRALRGWRAWGVACGIGLLTEGVQYLLPYRGFDINDMVANLVGITVGGLAVWMAMRRKRRRMR